MNNRIGYNLRSIAIALIAISAFFSLTCALRWFLILEGTCPISFKTAILVFIVPVIAGLICLFISHYLINYTIFKKYQADFIAPIFVGLSFYGWTGERDILLIVLCIAIPVAVHFWTIRFGRGDKCSYAINIAIIAILSLIGSDLCYLAIFFGTWEITFSVSASYFSALPLRCWICGFVGIVSFVGAITITVMTIKQVNRECREEKACNLEDAN